jgi:hypothetical protein
MERRVLRLDRARTAGGLALLLVLTISAAGCRSTRPEVPPGRGYSPGTGQPPPVSFSSQPTPNALNGLPAAVGTGAPGSQFGTPTPGGGSQFGAPTTNAYGPPGSAGLGGSPSLGAAGGGGGGGLPPAGGLPDPTMSKPGTAAAADPALPGVQPPSPNPF